jgi:hypothetical protein
LDRVVDYSSGIGEPAGLIGDNTKQVQSISMIRCDRQYLMAKAFGLR